MFVKNGVLMFENNFYGKERGLLESAKPLPKGKVTAAARPVASRSTEKRWVK